MPEATIHQLDDAAEDTDAFVAQLWAQYVPTGTRACATG